MVAVITDVHYRMSLALIRELAQAGVEAVTCERESCRNSASSPALGALSRYAARHVWLPEEGYPEALAALCGEIAAEKGRRPALLPVGAKTLEALARDQERFGAVSGLCIPRMEHLELFNSKERVAALSMELGVPVPEQYVRREREDVSQFLRRVDLPCVVKPVCGEKLGLSAAERYAVAWSFEEAERAYRHFLALAGEPPVVQGYLPGAGLGCSVLAQEGEILAAICHRRVREYPVSGGPSSCCVREERKDLREYAGRLVSAAGYTGLAMFEFKEDSSGAPRLLEVNPRIWGTFPLTRAAGSALPRQWFTQAWNAGNPEQKLPWPEEPAARRRKMIFAVSDLMAGIGYAKRGSPGRLLAALGDFVNPAVRDGVFEWGDPLPGLAYFRSLLAKERHG